MIRSLDQLTGLLGWKQAQNVVVDAGNLASSTSRKYNDFSPLVTTDNIYYTQPNPSISESDFNDYLEDFVNESIQQLMNSVFRNTDDLIENDLLYSYEFDFNHTIENDGDFVGFEIDVSKSTDKTVVINTSYLTFDAVDNVKLLLFHSDYKDPIQSQVVATLASDTKEQSLDWVLDKKSGKYYLGYLTGGLTAKAYDRNFELANFKKCFSLSYFTEIKVSGHSNELLFDVNDVNNNAFSWGLNFDVSGWNDWTRMVLQNKTKFVDAIGMQVCVNALDLMLNSTRSNRDERIAKANIMVALDGFQKDGLYTQGLRKRLTKEIDQLKDQFTERKFMEIVTMS